MGLGIFVVDRNYKVRHMNPTMARWFGDHSGKVCYESVAGLSAPCPYCQLNDVINESKVVHYEPSTPDGKTFRIVAAPVTENDGSISKMEIISDITDRKRTEEALAAKREWEDTFNSINDAITIHDKTYNITHYNTAAKRLLGLPHLVTSDVIKCYQFYHGKDCAPEACPSCRCFQTQQPVVSEFYEPHLNMFVEVRAIPRLDVNGQLTGLVHIVSDITDRKTSEQLIRIRLELLEFAASHSLEELLQKTLDEIGSLTNSPIGFYHFVGSDQETLSLQAWSTRTVKEFCQAQGKGLHYPSIRQAYGWTP